MRVYTRVKPDVDRVLDAELLCTVCDEWQPKDEFYTRKGGGRTKNASEKYSHRCKDCQKLYHGLSAINGACPTVTQMRESLNRGAYSIVASLNQARHPQREITPLSPEELKLRRERQEAKELAAGKPDLCYLVGMEGDDTAVKIGHSTNPPARLGEYQAGNPRKLTVLATIDGGQQRERELHQRFIRNHQDWMVGEWFAKDPAILNEFKVTI